jgi:hypothetical protein
LSKSEEVSGELTETKEKVEALMTNYYKTMKKEVGIEEALMDDITNQIVKYAI